MGRAVVKRIRVFVERTHISIRATTAAEITRYAREKNRSVWAVVDQIWRHWKAR